MFCPNRECPDFEINGVHGEFVDGVTVCPYCASPLVFSLDDDSSSRGFGEASGPQTDREFERVFETTDASEVEIVKSILRGADIPFIIEGMDHFSTMDGERSAFRYRLNAGGIVFMVPPEHVEEAKALLTETEPTEGTERNRNS